MHQHFIRSFTAGLGYFGVTVFFVISGFLITFLLLKERERSSAISLPAFYKRRAVRILPAFLLYTGLVVLVGHPTPLQCVYALTFTTSFVFAHAYSMLQQLWSLSAEEVFYLLWPFVLAKFPKRAPGCCWAVMVLSPLLRVVLKHDGYTQWDHIAPAILDSMGAGCLLALYQSEVRTFARRHLCSTPTFLALCFCSVAVPTCLYHFGLPFLWGAIPALVALVMAAAIEREDRILNQGFLVWSGLLSYSLYLWQQPILFGQAPVHFLPARLLLLFLIGYLSYRFVEQPVIRAFTPLAQPQRAAAGAAGSAASLAVPFLKKN